MRWAATQALRAAAARPHLRAVVAVLAVALFPSAACAEPIRLKLSYFGSEQAITAAEQEYN